MPASDGLPLAQLAEQRRAFIEAFRHLGANRTASETAAERLDIRLQTWTGSGIPSTKSRFKNKIALGADADCLVGTDRPEILIVRALSLTRGECQFTVTPTGAVYASEGNGWTIDSARIYVSGLSPLIDDGADILRQMRGPKGGRMFFDRNDSFLNAKNKSRFLTVVEGDEPPTVLGGAATMQVMAATGAQNICPTCFQILPVNGGCSTC